MGLSDLFKPKWKHSDPEVRKEAIEKINDQAILAEIARMDNAKDVRLEALKKLESQVILAEIAVMDNDGFLCEVAIRKLIDQDAIELVARTAKQSHIRDLAFAEIRNATLRSEIELSRMLAKQVPLAWKWNDNQQSTSFLEWIVASRLPQRHCQAEEALHQGHLLRWLRDSGAMDLADWVTKKYYYSITQKSFLHAASYLCCGKMHQTEVNSCICKLCGGEYHSFSHVQCQRCQVQLPREYSGERFTHHYIPEYEALLGQRTERWCKDCDSRQTFVFVRHFSDGPARYGDVCTNHDDYDDLNPRFCRPPVRTGHRLTGAKKT